MLIGFLGDSEAEGNEVFYVDVTEIRKVAPSTIRVAITIIDDDGLPPPVFSNLRATEGNGYGWRQFPATLTLPAPLPHPITYKIDVTDGTATWQRDYTANNGSITFQAGQTTAEVFVQILGDDIPEGDETFTLSVAGTNSTAVYTIVDDDHVTQPAPRRRAVRH